MCTGVVASSSRPCTIWLDSHKPQPLKRRGLHLNPKVRRRRLYDRSPISDIARSISIRKVCMPAMHTTERGLIRTVPLVHGSALIARLRCVARIDQHNGDAAHMGFVRDVGSKLEERPITVSGTLRLPNRCLSTLAHVGQICAQGTPGKRTLSAFGFHNKLFRNPVVGI